ncbi:MAG: helix-turn-helix transcriptional regulator [Clostridia bacterium]|nr:helix-turn-helix transcriptional regulator [Clostridia bacterium]
MSCLDGRNEKLKRMVLSDNIKNLRKEKNVTQDVLAKELNVSLKTVSHWETGYTEPSVAQLIQLACFFDVSVDELVGK